MDADVVQYPVEAALPAGAVRADRPRVHVIAPHGATVIEPQDHLFVFVERDGRDALEAALLPHHS